jgi:hypothetical protein
VPVTNVCFQLHTTDGVVYHLPLTFGPQTTDTEV